MATTHQEPREIKADSKITTIDHSSRRIGTLYVHSKEFPTLRISYRMISGLRDSDRKSTNVMLLGGIFNDLNRIEPITNKDALGSLAREIRKISDEKRALAVSELKWLNDALTEASET